MAYADSTNRKKLLKMEEVAKISAEHNLSPYAILSLHSMPGTDIYQILDSIEAPRELTLLVNTLKFETWTKMTRMHSTIAVADWYSSLKTERDESPDLTGNPYGLSAVTWKICLETFNPFSQQEDPPTQQEDPPTQQEAPPTQQEDLPTQQENPPTQQEAPPTQQEDSPTQQEDPPTQQEDPPTQQEAPPTQQEDPPAQQEDPPTHQDNPPAQLLATRQKVKSARPAVVASKRQKYFPGAKAQHIILQELMQGVYAPKDLIKKARSGTLTMKAELYLRRINRNRQWVKYRNLIKRIVHVRFLQYQEAQDYLLNLQHNRDVRIPEYPESAAPKQSPPSSHQGPDSYCMFYGCQGPSGMIPVLVLAPEEGDCVLDLCAAAGHNSILIGMLLKNEGMLVSNLLVKADETTLQNNLHRCAVSCSIVTHFDLQDFPKAMDNSFSHVLVDAPCSGIGSVTKIERENYKPNGKEEIRECSSLQKFLLLRGIDSLKRGGFIVYSTSSLLVDENEEVVQHALENRNVIIVPVFLPFGEPGLQNYRNMQFHESMNMCVRVYSHEHNIQGFFIAKMKLLEESEVKF
ncbi:hypothetical protein OTU49_002730 [Cherax quadricarinatus]|uniref:SAM-dependent MTase RsmB/NOP-type domain-containing protein n=1 Tax=Cherax quadricarinatus TaxID=27406 RepID=A0AAW0XCT9_CHEQU